MFRAILYQILYKIFIPNGMFVEYEIDGFVHTYVN